MYTYLNSDEYISAQKDILELAVKVVVHPSYGWIKASHFRYFNSSRDILVELAKIKIMFDIKNL